jgi:hypothetical protein
MSGGAGAADGTPDLEQLREPVVLRLALPWLSGP